MECEHDVTQYDGLILIRFNLLIIALHHVQLFPGFSLKSMWECFMYFCLRFTISAKRGGSRKSRAVYLNYLHFKTLFTRKKPNVFW